MKWCLIIPFVLIALNSNAQERGYIRDSIDTPKMPSQNAPITRSTITRRVKAQYVRLEGGVHFGSNGIDNSFTNKLIWGGHIDSLFINPILNDLDAKDNYLAGEMSFSAQVIKEADQLFKRSNLAWYIRTGYTHLMRLEFSKDVFKLAFRGNAQFEGSAADLSLRFQREHYQKIEFGLAQDGAAQSLGLGLYFGNSYSYVNTQNSILYTHDGGYQIDLALKANAEYSDSSRQGIFSGAGYGVGVNYTWTLREPESLKDLFILSLEDFGLMFWNKKGGSLTKDSLYTYNGFEISDLTNNQINFDNLEDTLGLDAQNTGRVTMLPFYLRFAKVNDYKGKGSISPYYGINYRYIYHRFPELYFGAAYYPSSSSMLRASIAYGGYYGLHCNFGLGMTVSNHISLGFSSQAVFNSLNPTGLGKSASIRLTWHY